MPPLLLLALLAAAPEHPCVHDPTVLGCPPPDRDGDGVPDLFDLCPGAPENQNHYQDADGCPDTGPMCPLGADRTWVRVPFSAGDADIDARSLRKLAALAEALRESPNAHGTIEGHASGHEAPTPEARQRLSERRAGAVLAVLVHRFGVASRQLTLRAYGDTAPIDTDRTAAGRRRNARVEVLPRVDGFTPRFELWFEPLPWDP